ncbi:isocitrate lyase/phosphoenolpyruvate mutase family protein [Burkholderia ubonensis]|uniref:isocitrate lyase/phosphoenolpyruvate mutase family protein n=1 Tax=Burkholderia ubonensis TaxID=101571 RepID=UPI0009B35359
MRRQAGPLLLANVWDVASARAAKAAGHAAVGTSSVAIADMLGHADGEGRKDRFPAPMACFETETLSCFFPRLVCEWNGEPQSNHSVIRAWHERCVLAQTEPELDVLPPASQGHPATKAHEWQSASRRRSCSRN